MNANNVVVNVEDLRTSKLRVRRLDVEGVVAEAVADVVRDGKPVVIATHGGSVCNNYGYYAETDGVAVCAIPHAGLIYVKAVAVNLPANKVTVGGVAARCGFSRAPFDGRFGRAAAKAALSRTLAEVSAEMGISE